MMHSIEALAKRLPTLKTAAEASEKVRISPERLVELSDARLCPHYRVDGGEPLFVMADIKEWVAEHLLERYEGSELPFRVIVNRLEPAHNGSIEPPPIEIASVKSLAAIQADFDQSEAHSCISGVYFLCKADKVVYVGQSTNVFSRVFAHATDKDFDRAFFLPCAKSSLDQVEGAFIRTLKPELSRGAPARTATPDQDVVDRYCT